MEPSNYSEQQENTTIIRDIDRDDHGCVLLTGSRWCPSTFRCQVIKKDYCEEYKDQYEGNPSCPLDEEYYNLPTQNIVLSIPFDPEDYSTEYWGMIPYCYELWGGTSMHWAVDYELKPDAKVYSATDGIVTKTEVGREEGSGEIITIRGNGFTMSYSGLKNIQFQEGDEIKRGDHMADAVRIPHGEHHIHMGISINGKQECPLKYMDEEFKEHTRRMFAQADYDRQSERPCLCNCEYLENN